MLLVLRAGLAHHGINRAAGRERLQEFLETAFGVHVHRLVLEILDIRLGLPQDKLPHGFQIAVEKHGADQRLERVCQRGSPQTSAARLLAAAHHEVFADADRDGMHAQPLAGDQPGTHLGEVALGKRREPRKKMFGKDQLQDGVAQEFEPLIVKMMPLRLVAQARVGQSFRKQKGIAEFILNPLFQRIHKARRRKIRRRERRRLQSVGH